jgi:hypothetical protein
MPGPLVTCAAPGAGGQSDAMARIPTVPKRARQALGWTSAALFAVALANGWLPMAVRLAWGALNLIWILVVLAWIVTLAVGRARSRRT